LKQNRPLADIMAKRAAAMLATVPPCGLPHRCAGEKPGEGERSPEESQMTPAQIQRVRTSFARAVLQLDEVCAALCRRLLRLDPDRGALFGGDPVVQRIKVGAALAGLVGSLGQLERIRPQLQALGRERARQGIDALDYARLGEALVGALHEVLGEAFDAGTRRAWIAAYGQIARAMLAGATHDPLPQAA
jgi:hemoglobin-like flavoprotein